MVYGNGARTNYTYDNARRLTVVDHRNNVGANGTTFLKLVYAYTDDDLPASITERNAFDQVLATTTFFYDARSADRLRRWYTRSPIVSRNRLDGTARSANARQARPHGVSPIGERGFTHV